MQPLLVHADEWLVAVDKPAGLLSVPGRGADKADCMAARVQAAYPDALVVHRLDMATSGLFLMARGPEIQRRMGAAFEGREVRKRYVAIVAGLIAQDEGEIDLPLAADWPNRPKQVVDRASGKPSRTKWRVLARGADTTRVELEPVTGRSHQLRVHLQAIGHPILGDALYAPPEVAAHSARLLLHAAGLAFTHPATGEPLALASPVPF
ncbi:RluA family pseudouridine synthase [Ramlibacter sp. PS4R-6]|uniref:RluA family pseudouridine synthase n=1 Tax=Ramlibacter sp. PS4R-6 TaxID=3133438 RepID=UPI0030A2CA40